MLPPTLTSRVLLRSATRLKTRPPRSHTASCHRLARPLSLPPFWIDRLLHCSFERFLRPRSRFACPFVFCSCVASVVFQPPTPTCTFTSVCATMNSSVDDLRQRLRNLRVGFESMRHLEEGDDDDDAVQHPAHRNSHGNGVDSAVVSAERRPSIECQKVEDQSSIPRLPQRKKRRVNVTRRIITEPGVLTCTQAHTCMHSKRMSQRSHCAACCGRIDPRHVAYACGRNTLGTAIRTRPTAMDVSAHVVRLDPTVIPASVL